MYHLPNIEVVKRLQRIRSRIYNSQQNGQVTIDLDDNLKLIQTLIEMQVVL